MGTASDDNLVQYTLEYSPKDKNTFVTFATGTTSVVNGVLGTLDTTTLLNDLYDIRLTAEDANGQTSSTNVAYRITEDLNRLLKKSFFSQTRPWANKSKILSAGLPEANRSVFEK